MRRQESFPWIIVMGGAVLYWTIALGIGIPSLYRVLGPPGPARRAAPVETRCVQAVAVDGTPIVFGDCFNVRFIHDSPELARPPGTVEHVDHKMHDTHHDQQQPEASDSVGRTSY